MPSSSKKQHNFMEAIAHSPSFAKKVHIPQSVGKDYAAADKGKTFSKGGDMKESKGMVGKEVAFFKKKGAPKSMIKHEESEMKGYARGGKVRRMAAGGTGDPFELSDTDRENYAKNGAENLKRFKGFFGFGDKEEAAPIDRSRDVDRTVKPTESYTPRPPLGITKTKSPRTSSGNSAAEDEVERLDAAMMAASRDKTAKGPQFISSIQTNGGELSGDGLSPIKKPKTPVKPAIKKPVGFEKTEKKERVITEPSEKTSTGATFKSDLEGRLDQMKPSRKFGMASDETRASVRKGLGSFMDFFDLSKAHEREFGKKLAKGGNVKRMRYGGSPEDGMDMGQPMRGSAPLSLPPRGRGMPAAGPEMNPNSIAALQAKYGMRPQGGPPMKAGGSVKKMAEGGFTREADGVAKKGKTQGKMVKMAGGGFVKSADGCAQRGKTRGTQVKMNRGGMC
jgi:hypothetical protein